MVDMYKQVADATAFVRGDGSRLHSLKALELALLTMPDAEFRHHVTSSKNDFANWVLHVFENKDLFEKLRRSNLRLDMVTVLEKAGSGNTVHEPEPLMLVSENIHTVAHEKSSSVVNNSKPLHHKLKGIFKKNESPVVASDIGHSHNVHHELHAQIDHLDRELAHLTRHHAHTTARQSVGSALLEDNVQERILDFSLGLIVGLMLGFVLAKSFGI